MSARKPGHLTCILRNHGLTVVALAKDVGMQREYLSRVLNGRRPARRAMQRIVESQRYRCESCGVSRIATYQPQCFDCYQQMKAVGFVVPDGCVNEMGFNRGIA